MSDINELLGHLGITPSASPDPAPQGDPNPTPTNDPEPVPAPTGDPTPTDPEPISQDPTPAPAPAPAPQEDKTSQAFAQMRIENKRLQQMMKGMADLLGVDGEPDKVLETVQSKLLEAKSKKDNIPVDILKRLEVAEQGQAEFMKAQLETRAYQGFQQVKDTFGLNDQELAGYVHQLLGSGVDPFQQPVDLVTEYKVRNFEAIVQKQVSNAIRAEQERAAAALNQGTTPNTQQGQGGNNNPEHINSVSKLNALFDQLQK